MSKQEKAKSQQGYDAKPAPAICSNCKHFSSEMKFPAWIEREVADGKKCWNGTPYTLDMHGKEGNLRCLVGGFAVKKTATCTVFSRTATSTADGEGA